MSRTISLLLALTVFGCATLGRRVNEGQLTDFVPGETTYFEVVATLGLPTNELRNPDGTRQIVYAYQHDQINPEAVIPGVGMLFKERSTEYAQTTIYFDQQNRYLSYSQSQGRTDYGRGPIAGGRQ
jgi:hypothetical protein